MIAANTLNGKPLPMRSGMVGFKTFGGDEA